MSQSKKDLPILYNGQMVKAILEGRKTQTRRIVKNGKIEGCDIGGLIDQPTVLNAYCPFGKIGDRLWVKETFSVIGFHPSQNNSTEAGWDETNAVCAIRYHADGSEKVIDDLSSENDYGVDEEQQALRASKKKTVPSILMPRWASRITLVIVDIRVERLKKISEKEALAEGVVQEQITPIVKRTAYSEFMNLWCELYGGDNWDSNPWVWVVEFKRV